ncbi:MAG: RNA-binding transcriptional accessory protein [Kosmotoga sp.]|nr:MAG: RNA-binding transcriptional accessory protein [Kosmotoga sp.]
MHDFVTKISELLNIARWKVENAVKLLDEGKTIPFISRYRKENTGELNETQLRNISDNLENLKKIHQRRDEIVRIIEEKGKMTSELKESLQKAETLQELENLYLPYKSKKETRADKARKMGLSKLANFLETTSTKDNEFVSSFINREKGVNNIDEAIEGAQDIIAEKLSQSADVRKHVKNVFDSQARLQSVKCDEDDQNGIYSNYYSFKRPLKQLAAHHILAIFRGEREKKLKVSFDISNNFVPDILKIKNYNSNLAYFEELKNTVNDALNRLIIPSVEREIRSQLKEQAENRAISVFSENLRNLLLLPPLGEKIVMGIDPGFRTGCKIAVIDREGNPIYHDTIYPTPPKNEILPSEAKLTTAINQLHIEIIAIGNGTASRETRDFVTNMIKKHRLKCKYLIVSEAGASVYSASKTAVEEFPDYDVTTRGAISIARRVQDPLAEYVKISPESLGIGMYQHDVNRKKLKKSLDREVESAVNFAGVNLNTASFHLLKYISGLNSNTAKKIVEKRVKSGAFTSRKDLGEVEGIGPVAFEQAAGFCRIINGDNPLDSTTIHPESYEIAESILQFIGFSSNDLLDRKNQIQKSLNEVNWKKFASENGFNEITVLDIVKSLQKPGLDPREELEKPLLRDDVMTMEQLKTDMVLEGTVRNVVDFGAFVDIGVKQDGLIHKSKMGSYVRDPLEVISVGQIVKVKVLSVDLERERISLQLLRR